MSPRATAGVTTGTGETGGSGGRRAGHRWWSPGKSDGAAAAAALALVGTATLVGWWLIEYKPEVEILVGAPPVLGKWMPHIGPGTVPAIVTATAVVLHGPGLAARLRWGPLLAVGYLTSLAWTLCLALVDGWERSGGLARKLTTPSEYLHDIPRVSDIGATLRGFTDGIVGLQPGSWTTHVAGHPPGAFLTFVVLDRLGLPGGGPAALLCIIVGASAGVAVAVTLHALGAQQAARAALPFGVLFPGAVWVGASADGLFAGVLAWGVALLAVGSTRTGPAGWFAAAGGGVLLGATLYLSYGLMLGGLLPLAVLLSSRRLRPVAIAAVGAGAVVAAFTAAGFWWWEGFELVQVRYYQPGEFGLRRSYHYWVWANLAALTLAVGPATAAGLRRLAVAPRHAPRPLALLVTAAALAVLAADLSGLSKAEVERIWLPFAVWLVASCALLPAGRLRLWLAGQAVLALAVNHLVLTTW